VDVQTRADDVLRTAGGVPGVVALAADRDRILYQGAFGRRDLSGDDPMTVDTVFWIASQSKALVTAAALQLVELGRVGLDDPVGDVLPELASPQVLEGFDEHGDPRLRPARRPITLRLLLTHTAGFVYDIWNADMLRYQQRKGIPNVIECRRVTLGTPLAFDPGERWEYGINIDWAGQMVERLSGWSLQDYLRVHLLDPLGMRDTSFTLTPSQRARLVRMHARGADGSLTPMEFEIPQQPEFFMGGGGLYGTGPDYIRFLRMILREGELDGVRVLRPETVREMTVNQIGDLMVGPLTTAIPGYSHDAEFFPGLPKKWSLGFMVNAEEAPTGRSAGSLAWAGLGNSFYWIDVRRGIAGIVLTQIVPFGDGESLALLDGFERAILAEDT
jgi:CubicO group peptidase (beta-lactamase class C family)